jgi:hypothetical protein
MAFMTLAVTAPLEHFSMQLKLNNPKLGFLKVPKAVTSDYNSSGRK